MEINEATQLLVHLYDFLLIYRWGKASYHSLCEERLTFVQLLQPTF